MKRWILLGIMALALILSLMACTTPDTPEETTPEEVTTEAPTEAPTDAPTEEVTTEETDTIPEEPADITNPFTSNLSANQTGGQIDQTDLSPYFTFGLNLGSYKTTDSAYVLDGISEMYAGVNGFYAFAVDFATGTTGPAYAFVRGTHELLSTDAAAQPLVAYFETDGSATDMGGAGIYARIDGGMLTLMLKVYDETAPSRVRNVYYGLRCTGTQLTLADSGNTVTVLVNGVTYATVELSGAASYDGFSKVEPATEFAAEAKVSLKDGTTETLTNTLIDSDFNTQLGLTVRAGTLAFSSVSVKAFSAVEVPEMMVSTWETDITQMPDFKVSGVFGSYMVLQRDMPIRIWGFSNTEGSTVTGTFGGETVTAQVDGNGRWDLVFSARPANKNGSTLTVSDDRGHSAELTDILIGDVWFVGGQSNAELTVYPCINYSPEFTMDANDPIRLFTQTQAYAASQKDACATPQYDVINPAWGWKRADRQAVLSHSAIGYFFAKEVAKQTDVPQGVIMIAAGGACLSELFPVELARKQGYSVGGNVCVGGYYNTLINPFVGYPCKGMLFFQGESEGGQQMLANKYAKEMTLLIQDERSRWGQNFPLYYVQLSDYRAEGVQYFPFHHTVRIQQFKALDTIPNSTMVVAMDLGAPAGYSDWAHSPYKFELGLRLAKAALAKEYGIGEESQVTSPMPVKVTLSEDKTKITVEFTNVADGLTVKGLSPEESIGKTVAGFSVGKKNRIKEATATITSKNTVVIDVPEGATLKEINYAYFMIVTPENATLYASNGLPAPAFSLPLE